MVKMLKFIKQLDDDFTDLLVAIDQIRYGDNSRLCEYEDKGDKRIVHLWDNEGSFKDNGQYYIWVNDYETSNIDLNLNHNIFMLYRFGQEWYASAQKYFENTNPERLTILNRAKSQYESELEADKEFMQSLDDENFL